METKPRLPKISATVLVLLLAAVPAVLEIRYVHAQRTFTAIADTELDKAAPTTNTGTATTFRVDPGPSDTKRGLVKFDLSSIPSEAAVLSVSLKIFLSTAPDASRTHNVHRVTADWAETEATWNNRLTATAWGTAGGDFSGTVSASATTGTTNGVLITWSAAGLVSDVQTWVTTSSMNFGFLIKDNAEGDGGDRGTYNSRQNAGTKPTLEVTIQFSRSASETITASDSVARAATLSRGMSESTAVTDSVSRAGVYGRVIAQALGLLDSSSRGAAVNIFISPSSQTIWAGQAATYRLDVSGHDGQPVVLHISGIPAGVTASFSPPSGVTPFSSTLTIQVPSSFSGSISFAVTGSGSSEVGSTTGSVQVQALFDFSLSVSCPASSVTQASSATCTVNVQLTLGAPQPVTLSATSLPAGMGAQFSPVSSNPPYTAGLMLTTSINTPVGSNTFIVQGTSASVIRTASGTLLVSAAAGTPGGPSVPPPPVPPSAPGPSGPSGPSTPSGPSVPSQPSTPPGPQPFDFQLQVSNPTLVVPAGKSTSITVSVVKVSSNTGPVSLTVSGQPSTVTTNLGNVQGNPTYSTQLLINVGANTPPGTSTLVITASGGGQLKTSTIQLNVIIEAPSTQKPSIQPAKPPKSACIIATAAYGSELAPQVQFLRDFRDNDVQGTRSGRAFLEAFNSWYYSWSPYVAAEIRGKNEAMAPTRIFIAPLITVLQATENFYGSATKISSAEVAMIITGTTGALLVGLVYLAPIGLGVSRVIRRRLRYEPMVGAWYSSLLATLIEPSLAPTLVLTSIVLPALMACQRKRSG